MVDLAIGLILVALAIGALISSTLFGSLTLFFAFGMLMAVAWARLHAPDLALAEAAIGAGLTGALLFNALNKSPPEVIKERLRHPLSATFLCLLVLALLIAGLWPWLDQISSLPPMVEARMKASGVDYPVTAVLLNFRAWDTLLEIAVLLVALLGVKVLLPTHTPAPKPWSLLLAWSKILAPVVVVVGGYLLWRGSHAPGGAFQAGALLASGAVMLRLNHVLPAMRWSYLLLRVSVLVGLGTFLTVAIATAGLGEGWLNYPSDYSKALIVVIETAATVSIAATLTLLVEGEGDELQS